MTVYAIVKEPWKSEEGYLARFRSEVFANKAKAVSALKDIARKIVREQIGDANGAELEFEKDEVRIAWGHAAGNGESPETTCLRVERLQVPKGRIEFEDGKASVEDWVELLKEQPRFAKHCDWGKIDGGGWVSLLKKYPRFAKHCNWELLRGRDWCELLVELPKFKTHLIRERLKDGTLAKSGWMVGFLEKFPEYISDCDLNELGEDWARFLMTYPQYATQCDFSGFCADDWGRLLPVHPEFIDKVNWSITWQKKYYCGCVLIELIDKLPEILSYCKWSELRGDVLVEVLKHFPGAADKCDWERLAEADWYNLLQTHPEYGDRCTCWGSFTGWQIGKLLSANAALARFMKFDEFSEEKLADILITSPNLCGLVDSCCGHHGQ